MRKAITILIAALAIAVLGLTVTALAQDVTPGNQQLAHNTTAAPGSSSSSSSGTKEVSTVEEFVIGTGDVLAINVWKEAEISRVIPVRSDGRISLPLIGEMQAGGRTPRQLEEEIAKKLKDYVSEPEVNVIVQEIKSQKFNVLGMVARPG